MPKKKSAEESAKSTASAVLAGALVVFGGFILYTYFSNIGKNSEGEISENAVMEESQTELGNNENVKDENNEVLGVGGALTPERPVFWRANEYKPGDITGSSYTVREGDTLWEIAVARYGNGGDWVKIDGANSNSIGRLSNGNPLITPGQVLVLPN